MAKDFTITLIGNDDRFSTLINEELDFATHPYEVYLQEMVILGKCAGKSEFVSCV